MYMYTYFCLDWSSYCLIGWFPLSRVPLYGTAGTRNHNVLGLVLVIADAEKGVKEEGAGDTAPVTPKDAEPEVQKEAAKEDAVPKEVEAKVG